MLPTSFFFCSLQMNAEENQDTSCNFLAVSFAAKERRRSSVFQRPKHFLGSVTTDQCPRPIAMTFNFGRGRAIEAENTHPFLVSILRKNTFDLTLIFRNVYSTLSLILKTNTILYTKILKIDTLPSYLPHWVPITKMNEVPPGFFPSFHQESQLKTFSCLKSEQSIFYKRCPLQNESITSF